MATFETGLDVLVPCIQPGSEYFASISNQLLNGDGFVVLKAVLTEDECQMELDRMWSFVTKVSPSVHRDDPKSWYPDPAVLSGEDPWPHSHHDRFQQHQAGWVFNDLREQLADRVYGPLFGTDELHCSKDGFALLRPQGPVETAEGLEVFVPPKFNLNHRAHDSAHVDSGGSRLGLHGIQGLVALEAEIEGSFQCWPRSYRAHRKIMEARRANGQTSLDSRGGALSADELSGLEAGTFGISCAPQRVAVERGDVILWRSDLVHKYDAPDDEEVLASGNGVDSEVPGVASHLRSAVFVSIAPAALTTESAYDAKMSAYQRLDTNPAGSLPCDEFSQNDNAIFGGSAAGVGSVVQPPLSKACKFYAVPPPLTERQAQLFGLLRYSGRDYDDGDYSESEASVVTGEIPNSNNESQVVALDASGHDKKHRGDVEEEQDGLDGWSTHSVGRSRHGPSGGGGYKHRYKEVDGCTDVARGAACGAVYNEDELLFCAPCVFY